MSTLATGSWEAQSSKGASRIQWCVRVCEEYFAYQGTLHKLLCKDLRRREHDMPTFIPLPLLPHSLEEVNKVVEEWNGGKTLRLLDVGSCYNPFHQYTQFQVTAIDIAPADKVRSCRYFNNAITFHLYRVCWSVIFSPLLLVTNLFPPRPALPPHQ